MRRRTLEVDMHSKVDNIIRGPGASEILTQVTGRPAAYIPLRRGFSCQEQAARDAICLAERLGYDVVITGPRAGGAA